MHVRRLRAARTLQRAARRWLLPLQLRRQAATLLQRAVRRWLARPASAASAAAAAESKHDESYDDGGDWGDVLLLSVEPTSPLAVSLSAFVTVATGNVMEYDDGEDEDGEEGDSDCAGHSESKTEGGDSPSIERKRTQTKLRRLAMLRESTQSALDEIASNLRLQSSSDPVPLLDLMTALLRLSKLLRLGDDGGKADLLHGSGGHGFPLTAGLVIARQFWLGCMLLLRRQMEIAVLLATGLAFDSSSLDVLSRWAADHSAKACLNCRQPFGLLLRRHHCRCCGKLFCDACSMKTFPLAEFGLQLPADKSSWGFFQSNSFRVCDSCYSLLNTPLTL
eukprot:PLAT844.1.p1 GENE.PLAT844.1~~PLAT844.1.p1  ORF type:complete len:357 (+),score=135.04 PLAT844.1:68-1072(+)